MARASGNLHISAQMQRCIDECMHCHAHCVAVVEHCLRAGGKQAEVSHIRLLIDCAEICQTSADFMIRASPLHTRTCALCAEICKQCAQECEQFPDDPEMARCAEACHHCADRCREMVRGN